LAQPVNWKSPLEDQRTNKELNASFGSEVMKETGVPARIKLFHRWKLKLERLREESRTNARARQSAKEAKEEAAELERLIKVHEAKKSAARARSAEARLKAKEVAEAHLKAKEVAKARRKANEVAMRPLEVGGPARIPKDADDFEEVCAEFSRLIFKDAIRTPKGPDGGVDVLGKEMVGQAKFHPSKKVVGHDVVALAGSRQRNKRKFGLFFHYGPGYSPDAIAAARDTDVILFSLDVDKRRFVRVR
jgi:hypothetical protein